MKLAIMQPYFFPYAGYFQLIAAVDQFVVYDNIQYTKRGWINRNRIYRNGEAVTFSLPLKGASDYLDICDRQLAPDFNRETLLRQIKGAYHRAPYFTDTFPLIQSVVLNNENNLFRFVHHSICRTCEHLGIRTEIRNSSSIAIDHNLRAQDKVLAMCSALNAKIYVNAIGGLDLYAREAFQQRGVSLKFISANLPEYRQFDGEFVPALSIIDVMMFNPIETLRARIAADYSLV
jgi:hypothetical protein